MCKSQWHLNRHKKNIHSNQRFVCQICGKIFNLQKNLKQHMISHEENAYFCPVCPNNYSRSQHLRKHVAEKHPEYVMPPIGTELKNIRLNEVNDQRE